MYKIEVEKTKNLIKFEISGFIKIDEANSLVGEFENALNQFKPEESLVLGILSDYKPASPEVLSVIQKLPAKATSLCKKIATVHSNFVAEMQGKRIEKQVSTTDTHIARFKTEEEALKYLFE